MFIDGGVVTLCAGVREVPDMLSGFDGSDRGAPRQRGGGPPRRADRQADTSGRTTQNGS